MNVKLEAFSANFEDTVRRIFTCVSPCFAGLACRYAGG